MRSVKRTQRLSLTSKEMAPQSFSEEYLTRYFPTTSLVKLKPNHTKTRIVAVDVSSIRLGNTEKGGLLGVRGAIVWKQESCYRYLRVGPFPFHITEKSGDEARSLRRRHRQRAELQVHAGPNILFMQNKLTTLLERWIQTYINETTSNSLILWDGSLAAGTPETSVHFMAKLLAEARARQNTVLSFSKVTRLFLFGYRLTDLIRKHPHAHAPCMLKIQNCHVFSSPICLMGNIYVAKLTRGNCAFRLDIDKQLPHTHVVDAVQKLIGNDLITQSYPETLRLAHIFSTFTATEVLGMQRCIVRESNIKISAMPPVRRILFGRFGKGPGG